LLNEVGSLFDILKYVCDIVVKSSRLLSRLLMSSCLPLPLDNVGEGIILFGLFVGRARPFVHPFIGTDRLTAIG